MMILAIVVISLILLFWGSKKFLEYCIISRERIEDFCRDVIDLVRKENIPIMQDVVALGLLRSCHSMRVITEDNWKTYADISNKHRFYRVRNSLTPKSFYNIFKQELCGDFSSNWQQALKEANTLRLENLSR